MPRHRNRNIASAHPVLSMWHCIVLSPKLRSFRRLGWLYSFQAPLIGSVSSSNSDGYARHYASRPSYFPTATCRTPHASASVTCAGRATGWPGAGVKCLPGVLSIPLACKAIASWLIHGESALWIRGTMVCPSGSWCGRDSDVKCIQLTCGAGSRDVCAVEGLLCRPHLLFSVGMPGCGLQDEQPDIVHAIVTALAGSLGASMHVATVLSKGGMARQTSSKRSVHASLARLKNRQSEMCGPGMAGRSLGRRKPGHTCTNTQGALVHVSAWYLQGRGHLLLMLCKLGIKGLRSIQPGCCGGLEEISCSTLRPETRSKKPTAALTSAVQVSITSKWKVALSFRASAPVR